MGKASDIYGENIAKEGRISTLNAAAAAFNYVDVTDNTLLINTPIYGYQSLPIVGLGGPTTRYQQYIRTEVLDNAKTIQKNLVLDDNAYAWSWGSNSFGQLGDNTVVDKSSPVSVLGGISFNQIASDGNTSLGLTSGGFLYAWGDNTYGTVGNNSTSSVSSPVLITATQARPFTTICAHGGSAYAMDTSGFVFAWGKNDQGQLGNNNTVNLSVPSAFGTAYRFVAIQKGIAIDINNICWVWGLNTSGQLGDGTIVNRSTPTRMSGSPGSNFNTTKIAKSDNFGMTLNTSGFCFTFGVNTYGSLGDNSNDNRSTPVSVLGLKNIVQIAVGDNHAMALDGNGIVWAWGRNNLGQVGDNTVVNKSSPVSVNRGVVKFMHIAANNNSSTALDVDGNLWCWGYSVKDNINYSKPVSIKNLKCLTARIY
jgi:alpha-tubulin suppressor-like RCC1 family protein